MTDTVSYDHTQTGKLHYWLWGLGIALAVGALTQRGDTAMLLGATGAILLAITPLFASLRVRGDADALRVNFGPLPLVRRTIPYSRVIAVQPSRSSWLRGLGIHGIPGRSWTWNIWGRDAVTLTLRDHNTGRDTQLEIGTNDRTALVAFLIDRLGERLPPITVDAAVTEATAAAA